MGMPFYKDPMSHGNLYIEFIVIFPKKNQISGPNLEKIAAVLGGKLIKSEGYSKSSKNKILEEFRENDLNSSPAGGEDEEEMRQRFGQGGGRQEVRCQNQ
jgi:DnaJ homolog subfamily A member 2